jgi:hypothetical protein
MITCNIHPWMKGWVRVFDHPYYCLTDENGGFSLTLVPAGDHRLKVWHPGSGWLGGARGKAGKLVSIRRDAVTDLQQLKIGN